jgi:carbon-monoxide dehydrogenase large subunit
VVVSAIVDALSPYGVRNLTMPATPYNVWKAIRDAKAIRGILRIG